jgi:hypothetical protein
MSYKLDENLDSVLREQMIEGGVPEDEVQPSINDIEEAMDKRLKNSNFGNEGFTDEDYASVKPELNNQLRDLIKHMRDAGVPHQEIMNQVQEIIEASIAANKHMAYSEGGNWFTGKGNWCEDCVNSGKAPSGLRPVQKPLPENVQIACRGCNNQEGAFNRDFGRDLIRKRGPRRSSSDLSVYRSSVPDEHLGWHQSNDNLGSSYYTLRLTGDQLSNITGALRVFLNQVGESNPQGAQILEALEALKTAEYDAAGSGLDDIPTIPEY